MDNMAMKFFKISFVLTAVLFAGCGKEAKFDSFADVSKPFFGYNTVNNWSSKNPSSSMETLVKNNIRAMPFEFFESPPDYADKNVEARISKFSKYIKESQKRKIILYVTLLNCNLGNPKTGYPEITAPKCDTQIMKAAAFLAQATKKYSNIYVTPCGEGGNMAPTYERKLQEWCKANMPRNKLVNNWGSRPSVNDGMGFRCVHPAGINKPVEGGVWNMSDHSITIGQLEAGGYSVRMNYARKMRLSGVPFLYYDNPKNAEFDSDTLRALKDALK